MVLTPSDEDFYEGQKKRYYVTVHCLDDVVAETRSEAIHMMYQKYLKKGFDPAEVDIEEVTTVDDDDDY